MTAPLFGSYGLRRPVVFGRRPPRASAPTSFAGEKLREVCAEISVILADPAYPDQPLPVRLSADGMAVELGELAQITIDSASGAFVLAQLDGLGDVLRTNDVDRLMDFVMAETARVDGKPSLSGQAFVDKSVGRPLKELEQAFILATLRRCNGNRSHTAGMLGISLRTLRNKLRSYWNDLLPSNPGHRCSEDGLLERAPRQHSAVITLPTSTDQRIRRAAADATKESPDV